MANLTTSLNTANRQVMAQLNGVAYLSGADWDPVQRWDKAESMTARSAGIDKAPQDWAPSPTVAAGNVDAGIHLIRYRYLDNRTGYVSNPSNEYSYNSAGAKKLTFNVAASGNTNIVRSTDAKVTHIVLEATTSGGTQFYKVTSILNAGVSTVDYNITDATLSGQTYDYADDGHDVPPYAWIIFPHRQIMYYGGRVVYSAGTAAVTNASANVVGTATAWTAAADERYFQVNGDTQAYKIDSIVVGTQTITLDRVYAGSNNAAATYTIFSPAPNVVYHSRPLYPESVPAKYFTKVLQSSNDRLRAINALGSDLILMGEATMERWSYSAIPSQDGQVYQIPGKRGCIWHHCAVNVEGTLYGLDRQGLWKFSGEVPVAISQRIDDIFRSQVAWAQATKFHACWHPNTRSIRWYVALGSDTEPYDYIEYEVDSGNLATGRFESAITASETVISAGRYRPIVGDERGFPWWADTGLTDGANPNFTTQVTVTTGATATVIPITTSNLVTTNNGLRGVPIYSVQANETRICTSNTASEITLYSPGFTSPPANGNTLYIGRVNAKLKTKALALGDLSETEQFRFLHVWFEPIAAGTLYVRVYRDYSAVAKSDWVADSDSQPGATIPAAGSTDIEIDLSKSDGYVRVPLGSEEIRVLEIEFEVKKANQAVEIIGWAVDGETDEYEEMS